MPGIFVFAAGNVTNDLTYRESTKDSKHDFLSFTMAANNGFFEGEEWRQTSTVWLNVKAFGALARNARGVIAKGRPVMVHGELKHETFDGADGHRHSSLDLKADAIGLNLRMCSAQYTGKGDPVRQILVATPSAAEVSSGPTPSDPVEPGEGGAGAPSDELRGEGLSDELTGDGVADPAEWDALTVGAQPAF